MSNVLFLVVVFSLVGAVMAGNYRRTSTAIEVDITVNVSFSCFNDPSAHYKAWLKEQDDLSDDTLDEGSITLTNGKGWLLLSGTAEDSTSEQCVEPFLKVKSSCPDRVALNDWTSDFNWREEKRRVVQEYKEAPCFFMEISECGQQCGRNGCSGACENAGDHCVENHKWFNVDANRHSKWKASCFFD